MGSNASAPTVQLRRIRLFLAVISFRKLEFRVMDVSRGGSEPLKRDTYVQLPKKGVVGDMVAWNLLKPLYGLSASCEDW